MTKQEEIKSSGRRLFVVSNRIPVSIVKGDTGLVLKPSSGGLVTALNSFLSTENHSKENFHSIVWVGSPGCSSKQWKTAKKKLKPKGYSYLPVFTEKELYSNYYDGFSNSTIWPLF